MGVRRPPRRDHPGGVVIRDERGAMAVEFLLLTPLLLLTLLLLIQWAVFMNAQRVAGAAAREGAVATGTFDGTETDGRRVAGDYLTRLDPSISDRHITATRTEETATVTVTGQVMQLVPLSLFDLEVSQTAQVPVERFVP